MSKIKFSEILTSDLTRAIQTTKEICLYHESSPITYLENLRDKSSGVLETKTLSEYKQAAVVYKGINQLESQRDY